MSAYKPRWKVEAFLLLKNIVGWDVHGVGRKVTENAVEGQLDYTSRLGYGLAWKRGGARSTYTAGNNYLISTHAHSGQPSPAPLPMLTYFNQF